MTVVWIGHSHDVSSRTATSAILQIGHEPGRDSTTSGCIGQVIDTGGQFARIVSAPPVQADLLAPLRRYAARENQHEERDRAELEDLC